MPDTLTADDVIRLLNLQPHPEGGFYREAFRDACRGQDRACSTAIYFLLLAGEVTRWHRVDAAEVWHWYGGSPVELEIAVDEIAVRHILGPDLRSGARPQAVVPADQWQRAWTAGAWSLTGCTVAPGFEFSKFELAPDDFAPVAQHR